MNRAGHRWSYGREMLLAALVLALTFLNFGHVAVIASGDLSLVGESVCGDPPAPGPLSHAPCHACRIDGAADVPPPQGDAEPVSFATFAIVYLPLVLEPTATPPLKRAQPRGPPALA